MKILAYEIYWIYSRYESKSEEWKWSNIFIVEFKKYSECSNKICVIGHLELCPCFWLKCSWLVGLSSVFGTIHISVYAVHADSQRHSLNTGKQS